MGELRNPEIFRFRLIEYVGLDCLPDLPWIKRRQRFRLKVRMTCQIRYLLTTPQKLGASGQTGYDYMSV